MRQIVKKNAEQSENVSAVKWRTTSGIFPGGKIEAWSDLRWRRARALKLPFPFSFSGNMCWLNIYLERVCVVSVCRVCVV